LTLWSRKRVAYASNELGNWEVYVSPFPSADGKWQVSTECSVSDPHAAANLFPGRIFLYVTADGQKFLINARMDETTAAPLSIILNWASDSPVIVPYLTFRPAIAALAFTPY